MGPGAELLAEQLPDLLGQGRPGADDLTPAHDALVAVLRRARGVRQGRSGQVYPKLLTAALGQKVTGKNGDAAGHAIARTWGEPAPGPRDGLRLLPEPRALARIPYPYFHPLNIERKRADLVRRIANRATALQRAASMPPLEGRAHLMKLPGIGPWTSGVVMGGPLGDPDAVCLGDYHLPDFVSWNLAGEARADDARMLQLLQPYAGHRGFVARLIKVHGASPPRFGPRTAVRDIRRH